MTPDQRRAHNILHGQTLLDEWLEYCGGDRTPRTVDIWRCAVGDQFPGAEVTWVGGWQTCMVTHGGITEVYETVCWLPKDFGWSRSKVLNNAWRGLLTE